MLLASEVPHTIWILRCMVLEFLAFQQVEPHVFTKNISTDMSTIWIDRLSEHMMVRSDLGSTSVGPSLKVTRPSAYHGFLWSL